MPIWSDRDLQILYHSEFFAEPNDWWIKTRDNHARSRIALLAKYMNCSKPVFLDVGCGYGHVMEKAIDSQWYTYGLDPSNAIVLQARERLGRAATIHIETFEDNSFQSNFFDAIHMDSVLEHLSNVQAAVQVLHRLLKKNGVAYILVPNEDRLVYAPVQFLLRVKHRRGETPKMAPLKSPYHIIGFDKNRFQHLFTKNGFSIRYLRTFRGTEPWRKTKAIEDMNLKRKVSRQFQTLCWSLGGLLGRGTMIEAIVQKI
jgi:SAM-dependent methyltransferase